jgi:LuxR family quorum sensing-dependent transcriptional regulator
LSEYTISQYLSSATRKVNASNRTHAVAIAAQMGYLS